MRRAGRLPNAALQSRRSCECSKRGLARGAVNESASTNSRVDFKVFVSIAVPPPLLWPVSEYNKATKFHFLIECLDSVAATNKRHATTTTIATTRLHIINRRKAQIIASSNELWSDKLMPYNSATTIFLLFVVVVVEFLLTLHLVGGFDE